MRILRAPREAALVTLVVLAAGALVLTFARAQTPDTTPPSISNVRTENTTSSSVQVRWTTDDLSSSIVEYGTTTSLGQSATNRCDAGGNVTDHCANITGLSPSTIYYYRVKSYNENNLSGQSSDVQFTTAASVVLVAPGTPIPSASGSITVGTSVSFYATLYSPGAAGMYYAVSQQAVFDWDDGTAYGFSGYVTPAAGSMQASPNVSHTFNTAGTFTVRAKAKAQDDARESAEWSPVYSITVTSSSGGGSLVAPGVPTASVSGSSVTLTWTDPVSGEEGFHIYRSPYGTSNYTSVGNTGANITVYTDVSVPDGSYSYKVVAYASGTEGPPSSTTSPVMVANSGGSGLTAPTLSVTVSGASVTLAWTDPTGNAELGFRIFRRYAGSSWSGTPIMTQPPNIIGYTDTSVASGSYEYKVQVYTSTASQDSNSVAVTIGSSGSTYPAAPTNLRLEPVPSASAIYLKWSDNATNEDKFNVEREIAGSGSWTSSVQLTGTNITSYSDTSVTAGTYYSYRVQACLSSACSEYAYLTNVSTSSGSGSGGTGGTGTPPRVTATYPGFGANGVGTAATAITITFDQAMLASSLSWSTVTLQQMNGGEPTAAGKGSAVAAVNGGVAYSSGSMQASFTPASALMAGTVYQLTVVSGSSGVQSTGGMQLDGNGDGTAGDSYTLLFKTAAATQASGTRVVSGLVVSTVGTAVPNVNVYAYAPQGGFSTSTVSGSDGRFALTLSQGAFIVGASVSGGASSPQLAIEVVGDSLVVGGAATGLPLPNTSAPFTITVTQTERSISGTVSDGTSLVSGASVWAYRTDGAGGAQATTNIAGSYVLHVGSGTWRIGASVPSIGPLPEVTRTVGTSDVTGVNFAPATTAAFTVSGRVYQDTNGNGVFDDGEGISGAIVRIEGTTSAGTTFGNDTSVDTGGSYTLRVSGGTYRVVGWSTSFGQLSSGEPFVVTANVVKHLRVVAPRTVAVNIVSGGAALTVEHAYVDFLNTAGMGNHLVITAGSSGKLQLPMGEYTVRVGVEGVNPDSLTFSGSGVSGSTVKVGSTDVALTVNVPSRRTIAVTVTDTQGVLVERAWVDLVSTATGARSGGLTGTQGKLELEAAEGSYQIVAVKPGYLGKPVALSVNAATAAATVLVQRAAVLVKGHVTTPTGSSTRAFVRAERVDEVGIAGRQVEADGTYELPLAPGRWRLFAIAEGYGEVVLPETIEVSSTAVSGKDIALSSTVAVTSPRVEPVVPATGGIVQNASAGVTLTIPAQALGTSSSTSSQVQIKETNSVIKTATTIPVGGKGVEVTATDASGKAITSLGKAITIELAYDPQAVSTADTKKLALAYWDETTGGWVSIGGVVDTTTHTLRASVDHLTVFTIILPFLATPASAASTATPANERTAQLEAIAAEATNVRTATADELARVAGGSRDTGLEQRYDSSIVARVVVAGTPAATRAQVLNFVTYGTVTTKKLGAGERGGVVNSFLTAFGRLPSSTEDWQDVLKIANGRFPSTLSATRESSVTATFQRIYGRSANRAQANDDAAVTVMAYGLRSANRNLTSEAAALKSFRGTFGKSPVTAGDWDAVRAIAYSGAKR